MLTEAPLEGKIRISYNSLVSLQDVGERHALLLNPGRLCRGADVTFSPIGGGVELTRSGQTRLQGLIPSGVVFEAGTDARFLVADRPDVIDAALSWLGATKRRERTPRRELREELVDELALLDPAEVERIAVGSQRRVTTPIRDTTERRGWRPGPVLVVAEVHDARVIDPEVDDKLHEAALAPNRLQLLELIDVYRGKGANPRVLSEAADIIRGDQAPPSIYWASPLEIRQRQTTTGMNISQICEELIA